MAIRWNANLENKLKSTVRRYNAKISRLQRRGQTTLPERVSIREIRKAYSHKEAKRRELIYELTELARFGKKGAETIVKTADGYNATLYEVQQGRRRRNRVVRKLRTQIAREQGAFEAIRQLPENDKRREEITLRRSTLAGLKSTLQNLLGLNFAKKSALKTAESNFNKFYSVRRYAAFYDNFFTALQKEAGFSKLTDEQLKELESTLRNLTPEELLNAMQNNPYIKSVFEYYPKEMEEFDNGDSIGALIERIYNDREFILTEFKM